MNRALAAVAEAVDGGRTAAEIVHHLSPAVPLATTFKMLSQMEQWGLLREGALEDREPVAWAEGYGGRFLTALVALLRDKLEGPIELSTPGACPVHLFASFADRHPVEPGEAGETVPAGGTLPRKDVFGGRGFTRRQAIVSCLAEGAEGLSARRRGDEAVVTSCYRDVAGSALHPEQLLHFSPRQYAGREAWNQTHGGHNWVPARFEESWSIDWVEAASLVDGQVSLIPASACYFDYTDKRRTAPFCAANSNGCASAATLDEAVVRGFCELVERDAVAMWWYGRIRRPAIDLDSVDEADVRALRAWLTAQGRQLWVLDLTADLEIPVTAAISADREGKQIIFGFGAHLYPRQALRAALTELQQIAASAAMISQHYKTTEDPATEPSAMALLKWIRTASLLTERYLQPATAATIPYDLWCRRFHRGSVASLDDLREICGRHQLTCLVVDLTRGDIGIPTARVVAPDLRHFWARFGPGRLYDVPEKLQWLPRRLSEDELNPVPLFL